ncbi:MAG: methylenetetrahydrofolate reductase [NAD(P)H] [Planctomycetota bacterium]|nr:methylenetetrahydrofolate reductase [NAD(P)H] [Planctomycetota bacterium]
MQVAQRIRQHGATVSFEFFPPKDDAGWETLFASIAELEPLRPSFVSVTYGAGGSTRERTHALVERLLRETTLTTMPHLTGVGHTRAEVDAMVDRYQTAGVRTVLALRGDARKDDSSACAGDFSFAVDLVRHLRNATPRKAETAIEIGVAGYPEGHPETPNTLKQMDHLKAKIDAGADFIVTQLFFDNRAFLDWRDRCELAGIRVPIIAGIMPVTTLAGLHRMAELAAGARFPASLLRAIDRAQGDAASVRRVGIHWATEQCRDLLDHKVHGLHFYTLNRSDATRQIFESLGIRDSTAIATSAPRQ